MTLKCHLLRIVLLIAAPVTGAFAQAKPSNDMIAAAVHDYLVVKFPSYLEFGTVSVAAVSTETEPPRTVYGVSTDFNRIYLDLHIAPGQVFYASKFRVMVTTHEDLYEAGQTINGVVRILKTADNGFQKILNGSAATSIVSGALVTIVLGFEEQLPPGLPRSNPKFGSAAVVIGSPEERPAIEAAKKEQATRAVAWRERLIGEWKGESFCRPNSIGTDAELVITSLSDNNEVRAKYTFLPRAGSSQHFNPGSYSELGILDQTSGVIKFTPNSGIEGGGSGDQPVGFTLTVNSDGKSLSGFFDQRTGPCSGRVALNR